MGEEGVYLPLQVSWFLPFAASMMRGPSAGWWLVAWGVRACFTTWAWVACGVRVCACDSFLCRGLCVLT